MVVRALLLAILLVCGGVASAQVPVTGAGTGVIGSAVVVPAFVSQVAWQGQNPSDPSGNINTTGANFLFFQVSIYDQISATAPTPSDSKTNTWTLIKTVATGGNVTQYDYISWAATTGTGHNFSCGCVASQFQSNQVMAFSGILATGNPLDQSSTQNNGSGASAASIQPGSITPLLANELVITTEGNFNNTGTNSTISVNGSYTATQFINTGAFGVSIGGGLAYNIQTTATATNPTWTLTSTTNQFDFLSNIFSFKP